MSLRTAAETITWVGQDAQAPAAEPGEPVVEAAGRWLLPGLIDLHVHLTFDPQQADLQKHNLTRPIAEQALLGARHARLLLEAGFTSARDLGAFGYANLALKHAIDAGWIAGPRLVTCGWFLTVPGGHFDHPLRPELELPFPHVVSGPDAVRRAVREQVKRGADWIKVLATGGVLTGSAPLDVCLWETEELQAAVGMARRLRRPVAAHCHGAEGMMAAAEAGVTTIEHGTMGDVAAAEAMARNGTVLVPTFCAGAAVVREARAGRLSPALAEHALAIEPRHGVAFRAALAAGVKIACGTDTGVPGTAFGRNAEELGHLVAHGLSPEQALLAATRDAAAVLGWSGRLGTLVPGRLADFLLLGADPLADVTSLAEPQHLHLVVKGGQLVADRRPDR
ncbi:MAG TPA: amidohydrolase family protein [Chloroflexota bacterium]|nr:amidohydrolase family protein [Chloroflexota bacterium]